MSSPITLILTALAPAIWGSTYIVTTQMLPQGYPLTLSMLRALPTGIFLLCVCQKLPPLQWIPRLLILGALNFAIFWTFLFIGAYRLPGGVAATLGAVQPLMVLLLSRMFLGSPLNLTGIISALTGIFGVALLILGPEARLDIFGIIAALLGALSMAFGVVLTKKWQPPVSALTFTAWQLTAGGLLILLPSLIFEPPLPTLNMENVAGFIWLGLVGAGLTYYLWFRGIQKLGPVAITPLGFVSPLSAVLLGWLLLDQSLTWTQLTGAAIVLGSIWFGR